MNEGNPMLWEMVDLIGRFIPDTVTSGRLNVAFSKLMVVSQRAMTSSVSFVRIDIVAVSWMQS